ncbi:MAG TPA: hypothetical protein VG032_07480 [Acidimicrobiales bacterium]|nr:hypothetical protein [Acidimicrobiales bacterium]
MAHRRSDRSETRRAGLSNLVGGAHVGTIDGSSPMVVNPSTEKEYLEAPFDGRATTGSEVPG